MKMKNSAAFTKITLIISILLLITTCVLGTVSSLAWFTVTTEHEVNTFIVGDLNLELYYLNQNTDQYDKVDVDTNIFGRDFFFEPGHTEVVYLMVQNEGTVDFDYRMSIDVFNIEKTQSVLGNLINLPDYLRFGVVFGTEKEVRDKTATRELARVAAGEDANFLGSFSKVSDLEAPAQNAKYREYAALIIYMPEDVGNEAKNFSSSKPMIEFGIKVFATQKDTMN